MKIVVTGASGFLGSWFCRVLAEKHDVTALLREDSSIKRLVGISNLNIIKSDVDNWAAVITTINPDAIVLNDWWGVGNKHKDDVRQFENLVRQENILNRITNSKTRTIVCVGSQAELGPVSGEIGESQPDGPTTTYGEAKVLARKQFFANENISESRRVWLRVFSTYGPLDNSGWLITDTIRHMQKNETMLLTLGEQDWSYLHAFDLAVALKVILENSEISGIVNCGNPKTVKIRDVASYIANAFGKKELIKLGAIPYRSDQVMELKPKCEKLTAAGWEPQVDLESGLDHLIGWFNEESMPLKLNNGQLIKFDLQFKVD